MHYLEEIDFNRPGFGQIYDELPLWSAPFGQMLLEAVPLKNYSNIVDIGSGTGFIAIELAQRCGRNTKVFAIDPWQEAVNRLKSKTDFLGINNIFPICEDFVKTDLDDNSIDVIVSNLGINNFDNPQNAFQTCHRILKDNGQMVFTSNLAGHMAEFYSIFQKTLKESDLQSQIDLLENHINHRATLESVSNLLHQVGFEVTNITLSKFHIRFTNGTALLNHFFIRLGFMPAWKEIIPKDKTVSFFQKLEHNLNSFSQKNGELSLTIPMACFKAEKIL